MITNELFEVSSDALDRSAQYELKTPEWVRAVLEEDFYYIIKNHNGKSIVTGAQDKESFEEQYKQL